jgi:hypothetical protein
MKDLCCAIFFSLTLFYMFRHTKTDDRQTNTPFIMPVLFGVRVKNADGINFHLPVSLFFRRENRSLHRPLDFRSF